MRTSKIKLAALLLFGTACGGTSPAVKPDEMSADQHKQEAKRETNLAQTEQGKYRPGAEREVVLPDRAGVLADPVMVYNPTADHLRAAEWHAAHGKEHAAAAHYLERFEEGACGVIPPEVRAACPLLGPVISLDDIPTGVRARLATPAAAVAVAARMRCHYAYARARGFGVNAGCPLYVRGIEIKIGSDPATIEIVSSDRNVQREVRLRSREEAIYAKAQSR